MTPRICLLALIALAGASPVHALELKNLRPCYAPLPFGANRTEAKCLPGDFIFITYDIEGLKVDDKTGKASFVTILELFDSNAKPVFEPKKTPSEVVPHLGGTRMPGDLHIQMGRQQKPGRYIIRITVQDRHANDVKSATYQFDLLPPGFGLAGIVAPAAGFAGQHHSTQFALIDLGLGANKQPDVKVEMRVLDEAGRPVAPSVISILPRDLPPETNLEKENIVPMHYPLYLNRPGRFIIDILARDNVANKETRLTYPLYVLDFTAGK